MTYVLQANSERPNGFWLLDDESPFPDSSGYGNNATTGAAEDYSVPVVRGASKSLVIGDYTITFPVDVYAQGHEREPFTLEAWVLPISGEGFTSVLSKTVGLDGLAISHNEIRFSTEYVTADAAAVTYAYQYNQIFHIVGVHTDTKNELYVNGALVGAIDLEEDQFNDTYLSSSVNLVAGDQTDDLIYAGNGFAYYSHALTQTEIADHYAAGTMSDAGVIEGWGGRPLLIDAETVSTFLELTYDLENETLDKLSYTDGSLFVDLDENGDPVTGTLMAVFPLDYGELTDIYGVALDWDGIAVVEASVDGTTWETAVPNKRLGIVPDGYNPTGKILQIRVTLDGENDYLSRLTCRGYVSSDLDVVEGRNITVTGDAQFLNRDNTMLLSDNQGIVLDNSTLTISADPAESARTIEFWIKRLDSTSLSLTLTSSTSFQNGVAISGSLQVGRWYLIQLTLATDITSNITITGTAVVASITMYPDTFTFGTANDVFKAYTGQIGYTVNEISDIIVDEPATPVLIYAHDWAVTGGQG